MSEESRRAVRVAKPIDFHYWADSPPVLGRIEDISDLGLYVDTAGHSLQAGDVIEFRFSLPEEPAGEPIEGKAMVVWSDPGVGAGLEFLGLPQETRDRIRFFVASVFFSEKAGGTSPDTG